MGVVAVELPADAEQVLREGGLAILPTDTVYGLAAAADSLMPVGACTGSSSVRSTSRRR